jgi:tetratricopeptide (TPR) repeat protein
MTVYVTGTHNYLPVATDERPGLSRFRDKFLNGRGERVMSLGRESGPVRCWEEQVTIPTYPVQEADPNPMFLEKRVYQGSSGKVYPNPFTDRVALEKVDATYKAVFLENEFVQLMLLPEIGGRIHAGLDKTNGYDFFYRQHVIKPALVGLLGPWISGGVEFNWPQHHRPSTYMPVYTAIEEHADGSRTVWLSEHDPMLRMKGMVGIHLAPGKAIVEAKVRLYNRTPLPQTFLWWANVAVRVHDRYQAFFPPDVTFVADHARRAISSFPIARGSYYGVDYTPGTDISWYKNIPVPTSYMVTDSKYDFFGGYDHGCAAGVVHTSNHLVAPGKKLWTWGNAEFGYAWDRNLTDDDGPYVELMAGAYTDNQPDFSWLQPYETKTFSQYWYPIQKIGPVKNANTEAAVNLEFDAGSVRVGVCVTERRKVRVTLTCKGQTLIEEQIELAPGEPLARAIEHSAAQPEEYRLCVLDNDGTELIVYQPQTAVDRTLPGPATEPQPPLEIASADELYVTGLHLEQYRHATRSAEDYWREGLRRDADDSRMNNAMGLVYLRKGRFAEAEEHFTRAIHRLTLRNPNPYDGEPFYNLGLARFYQGKNSGAYEAFHKSVWNYAWQSAGYYALASISAERGELRLALEQVEKSLLTNSASLNARGLKAALLRRMGRTADADALIDETLALDRLCFRLLAERFLLSREEKDLRAFVAALDGDTQTLLDLGYELAWSGFREDACALLRACSREECFGHPMLWYTLSWLAFSLGDEPQSRHDANQAETASPRYCFPARLEEMIVLEDAIARNPAGARAHYYLGNLYYDKRRYEDAIRCWRRSVELDDRFSIPFRNLGIAEFNIQHNPEAADRMYARAFAVNPQDARVLYEWDQLKKRAGLASPQERLRSLQEHQDLVEYRDDLSVEYITLLNQCGQGQAALQRLSARRFSPWEGGEGLVSAQYVHAHRALGLTELAAGNPARALEHFEAARLYPENLGEGKHLLTLERDLDYFSGLAAQMLGDVELAQRHWKAAAAPLPAVGAHSYFQALAQRKLDDDEAARAILSRLAQFAERLAETDPKIDYFATSLPNLLLFDDDLVKRNRVDALFLNALVNHGLGDAEKAAQQLEQLLAEDPNHLLAAELLRWLKLQRPVAQEMRVERTEP